VSQFEFNGVTIWRRVVSARSTASPLHRLPADEIAAGVVLSNEITDARADIDRAFDDQIAAAGAISDDHWPKETYL
jgi:hypothetical protein